jgi:diaminohydroxyphosphoribosylaminopyrimidine deaminase / 5-amino-6-(5-phosphoribosylamino)uracil reductase
MKRKSLPGLGFAAVAATLAAMLRSDDEPDGKTEPLAQVWPDLLAMAHGGNVRSLARPADCALWPLYASVAAGRADHPFVIGQLGQSLDGRVATSTGKSRYINGPEGICHLHRLRALVDAVVVGVGTVAADDPQLTVREVDGPSPSRVVIDPNFRMPPAARLIGGGAQVFAVQAAPGSRPPGVEPIIIAGSGGWIDPGKIVRALAERGFRRILVEGGAKTVSAFLAAGALDRLHLSVAPVFIGAGPVGLNLPPIDKMAEALRPAAAATYRLGSDTVFDCALQLTRSSA